MGQFKTEQLQVRVTRDEKRRIKRRADAAGMEMSSWVLARLLPAAEQRFQTLLRALARSDQSANALTELNDWLSAANAGELVEGTRNKPDVALPRWTLNYVAAMIEHAAERKSVEPPAWLKTVQPDPQPWFASELVSLRLHLLKHSPLPFRRRNLFIDASLGDRV